MILRPFQEATLRKQLLSGFGMMLVAACASSPPDADNERDIRAPLGALTLSGPTFGQRALVPTACASGERQFFLGFDLGDARAGIVTRLVVDPATGPIVRVFAASAPFDRAVVFRQAECRAVHFSIESTAWRINRVQQLNVSIELDCQLPSGDSIVGKAADLGCL